MKTFLVRGVPASIQQDGWWMDGPVRRQPPDTPNRDGQTGQNKWERPILLLALIALADALLWGVAPGLSLAVFGMAVLLAAFVLSNGRGWGGLVLGAVLFLPLIEQVQFLSVLFWLAGLSMGAIWIGLGGWQGLRDTCLGATRLLGIGPFVALFDAFRAFRSHQTQHPVKLTSRIDRFALGWTLPIGLGLVFLSLLIEANPVASHWVGEAWRVQLPDLSRAAFWAGIGLMIWPFLRLTALRQRLTPAKRRTLIGPRRLPGIVNPDAVRRSLILFNLIFAMQTGLDAAYLWGGATLPEGMSYATYAHRGAYPLLVTALLAGAFALMARPFTGVDPLLRAALIFWMVQTVLLVVSSILRLELYVEAYGLTRLRLAAGIWMAVVATGLCLTLWQILRHHSAAWLLKRCFILGVATLYLCMFVSFDRAIARYNLTHDVPLDTWYLCTLGPAAQPELRQHAPDLCGSYAGAHPARNEDWREWGFRDWRVLRSLSAMNTAEARI